MNFKKLLVTTCLAGSILSLTACSTNDNTTVTPTDEPTQTVETEPTENTMSAPSEPTIEDLSVFGSEIKNTRIYEINTETLLSYLGDETSNKVIYIGSPSCSHCRDAVNTIHETADKYDTDVYHLSLDKVAPDEGVKLLEILDPILMVADEETGMKDFFIPHVFAIQNGNVSTDYSEIGYSENTSYDYIFEMVKGE